MTSFLLCDPDSLHSDEQQQDANILRQLIDILSPLACEISTLPALSFTPHLHQLRSLCVIYKKQYVCCPYRGCTVALLNSWLYANDYIKLNLRSYYLQYGPLSYQGDDVHIVDDTAYLGHGLNTDYALIQKLSETLNLNVRPLHLVDRSFRCLLEAFTPINDGLCLAYLPAFDKTSQQLIQDEFTVLNIPKYEIDKGACNAIVIDNTVIIPEGCEQTQIALIQHGFQVVTIAVNHEHYRKYRVGLGHYALRSS